MIFETGPYLTKQAEIADNGALVAFRHYARKLLEAGHSHDELQAWLTFVDAGLPRPAAGAEAGEA